jgi:hypothetical protein
MSLELYSKGTTDTLLAAKLDLAGGTMTGALTLSASGIIFSDATYLTTAPAGSALAADQLTAGVVTANPVAGPTAAGDVLKYDGAALIWAPGGGGGSAVWGGITGTVTDQTDLTAYLASNYYPLGSNPSGYVGEAPIDGFPYVRKNGAWDINSAPVGSVNWGFIGGYLADQSDLQTALNDKLSSSTASTTYLALAGGTMTGAINTAAAGITFSDSTTQTTAWTGSVPGASVNQVTGGPYTLVASDANNIVRCTSFVGNTLYLPDDSTAAIPVGSRITILVDDSTNLPVNASGSASLLWNYGGPININNTNGGTAVKVAADTWFLMRP